MANVEIMQAVETGTKVNDPSVTIKNKSLQSQTKAIIKLMYQMKANMFEIAMRLKAIQDGKMYESDGFEDVQDYAQQVFGYKKSMTYNLLRVADMYLIQDGRTYHSLLAHENNDYTVSQLQEVVTIEPSQAKILDANAVISPDMTTKEIRAQVKKFRNGDIDEKGNELETAESDEAEPIEVEAVIEDSNLSEMLKCIKQVQSTLDDFESRFEIDKKTQTAIKNILMFCAEWVDQNAEAVITAKDAE